MKNGSLDFCVSGSAESSVFAGKSAVVVASSCTSGLGECEGFRDMLRRLLDELPTSPEKSANPTLETAKQSHR